ncbi:GNAT family N-acetyltransferase [Luteirhabdus pelagi]|uniref:GNAT family N-acetyltransferase n=1 Tax=Luteirhabdus pelagi TaxID=2792783 RepID=UPI00193AB2E8|nr:GNAT family N-acetyltransferase [Luteirhabdus pelagi]
MSTLKGEKIYLRALEPEDLEFLYQLENDEEVWYVSNTSNPFSKHVLKQYLENSHRDIYEIKQLRFMICTVEEERSVGCVDLFDFDPKHKRAGVGVVIAKAEDRKKGYAYEALQLLEKYGKRHLSLHQFYASIPETNERSLALFKKAGFEQTGVMKDWLKEEEGFQNVVFLQILI